MANKITDLLKEINKLPNLKQRGIAAIVGATVADAATRPFHWVYNQEIIRDKLGESKSPEFWPENICGYYETPLGSTSSYNAVAHVGLCSLHEHKILDINDLCKRIAEHFGPGTDYQRAMKLRDNKPVKGPWINKAVIKFLENLSSGKDKPYGDANDDGDAFCLAIPYIAYFTSKENMWDSIIKHVVNVLTTLPETVSVIHAETILLQAFINGVDQPNEYMKTEFKKHYPGNYLHTDAVEKEYKNLELKEGGKKFGLACGLPKSYQTAHLVMFKTESYVDAVRQNIMVGGDNCTRANLIGSCYGAKFGIEAIPVEWMEKTSNIENILQMCLDLFSE